MATVSSAPHSSSIDSASRGRPVNTNNSLASRSALGPSGHDHLTLTSRVSGLAQTPSSASSHADQQRNKNHLQKSRCIPRTPDRFSHLFLIYCTLTRPSASLYYRVSFVDNAIMQCTSYVQWSIVDRLGWRQEWGR
jgi:hypothetical protein